MKNLFLIFLFSIALVGCANFAYPDRTFIEQMDHETDGFFVPGQDFAVVPGDNGYEEDVDEIRQRTPASAYKGGGARVTLPRWRVESEA